MDLITEIAPSLIDGLKTTLLLFFIIVITTIPLGFLVACVRVYAPKWITWIIQVYIYVMRGTPLLLQLMVVFFGLPFVGITFERFGAAVFTLPSTTQLITQKYSEEESYLYRKANLRPLRSWV